jgi:hypothetical protein
MKLDRWLGGLAMLVAVVGSGCGANGASAAQAHAAQLPSVARTRVMAAEIVRVDDAPRVGKPQHSRDEVVEDPVKDGTHRHVDRRGAGFSRYK